MWVVYGCVWWCMVVYGGVACVFVSVWPLQTNYSDPQTIAAKKPVVSALVLPIPNIMTLETLQV